MHSYALQLILYLAYFFWAHSKSFLDVIYIVLATIDLLVRPPTPVLCACAHTLATHQHTHRSPSHCLHAGYCYTVSTLASHSSHSLMKPSGQRCMHAPCPPQPTRSNISHPARTSTPPDEPNDHAVEHLPCPVSDWLHPDGYWCASR